MEKRLNKFGLSSPTRLELMIVLLLLLFIPFYSLGQSTGVLGESTTGGGPTPTPPSNICKEGLVEKFSVSGNCGRNKFTNSEYKCKSGNAYTAGSSCKDLGAWYSVASRNCNALCKANRTSLKPSKTPTPKPPKLTPTKTPHPTLTSTPTPTPQATNSAAAR